MGSETRLLPHAAAQIFPMTNQAEYDALKVDIEKNGQREDIVIYQNQILDGRRRYNACLDLGIEPKFHEHDGSDPLAFVISKNVHRRHLNPSQLALVAAQTVRLTATTLPGQPQICGGLSRRQAARMCGVSLRQFEKASALLSAVEKGQAIPELVTAVRNGDRRLHPMEKLSRATLAHQRKALAPPVRGLFRASRLDRIRWDRDCDQITSRTIRPIRLALGLAMEAEAAGELTPERWKRLVDSCREAERILKGTTDEIARMNPLPFEDA